VASRVNHAGEDIEIEPSRGTVRCRALICTLPTNLIAAEFVRFSPPLHDKLVAAAGLPLGHAEKVLLSIDAPELLPVNGHLFGKTDRRQTGSYDLRPLSRSCIQALFGGSLAMELANKGALVEFAIEESSSPCSARKSAAGSPTWHRPHRRSTALRRGRTRMRYPVAAITDRSWQRRSIGFSSPARPHRRTSSRLPTAHNKAECVPPRRSLPVRSQVTSAAFYMVARGKPVQHP
jgi:hypothetical protein